MIKDMKKIIIKLPDKKHNKFRYRGANLKGRNFLTAAGLINALRRCFPTVEIEEKTCVILKDDGMYVNESYPTKNPLEMLYCVSCFLEDFLSKKTLRRIEKDYLHHKFNKL